VGQGRSRDHVFLLVSTRQEHIAADVPTISLPHGLLFIAPGLSSPLLWTGSRPFIFTVFYHISAPYTRALKGSDRWLLKFHMPAGLASWKYLGPVPHKYVRATNTEWKESRGGSWCLFSGVHFLWNARMFLGPWGRKFPLRFAHSVYSNSHPLSPLCTAICNYFVPTTKVIYQTQGVISRLILMFRVRRGLPFTYKYGTYLPSKVCRLIKGRFFTVSAGSMCTRNPRQISYARAVTVPGRAFF
jgi:hypothetical protein